MKKRVLIIEDEILIAVDLASELESAGYQVLGPTTSVGTTLHLLEEFLPDVAILDMKLQGEPTRQVALRLIDLNVPIIICSGYDADDLSKDSVFTGAAFLTKPLNYNKLHAILEASLRGRTEPDRV